MNRLLALSLLTTLTLSSGACEKKPEGASLKNDSLVTSAPLEPAADSTAASGQGGAPGPAATPATPTTNSGGIAQVISVGKGSGKQAADFSWKGSDGATHSLSDY